MFRKANICRVVNRWRETAAVLALFLAPAAVAGQQCLGRAERDCEGHGPAGD